MIPFEGFPHVIESQQFSRQFVEGLFPVAEAMRKHPQAYAKTLDGVVVCVDFGEVSTRTFKSFDIGAKRLGAIVSGTQAMDKLSSVVKGESFADTVRTIDSYEPNFLVMRWPVEGSLAQAAALVHPRCSVINAGDGPGQHPTQALLDLYTIWRQFRSFDRPIVVGMVGDLQRGRTVHSLTYLMAKVFPQISFVFISPESCKMKPEIIRYLDRHQRHYIEVTKPKLYELAEAVDVLYMTRPQLNLEPDVSVQEQLRREYREFILTAEIADRMKSQAIILHPLPRNEEIQPEVDQNPRARYFEQAGNGMWIRMALLERIHHARTGHDTSIPG